METASFHGLDGLTAILDPNKLGQRGATMHGWQADVFRDRAEAFGWSAMEVDRIDVVEIDAAYARARDADRPTMIVARTEKGHGVSFVANAEGWHGKALSPEQAAAAIEELGGERNMSITPPSPSHSSRQSSVSSPRASGPYTTAHRDAQGLRRHPGVARQTTSGARRDRRRGRQLHVHGRRLTVAPERFLEVYIAEQTMVGAQVGMQALGKIAFSATFGAFYTRATTSCGWARSGAANLRLCGSHAGVSIGEDGPSQMALEDIAAMRALHGSTVLYPADGNATVQLVAAMCDLPGISYIRTTREATPLCTGPDESFPVGGSKTVVSGPTIA